MKATDKYNRIAWMYEKGSKIYSTNQIRSSKRYQLNYVQSGDKILYLGVGAGEDAILAVRAGAIVTCIDLSQSMLDELQKKLDAEGLSAELICGDVLLHDRLEYYDVCIANYFLNEFRQPMMVKMLNFAATMIQPNGRLLIADVAPPQGNILARSFNFVYLKMAMGSFWLMGLIPLHAIYDYTGHLDDAGLEQLHVEYFRFAQKGPVLFQCIVAKRKTATA